jgi:deoxyadenosine/deoxycytidine kinase
MIVFINGAFGAGKTTTAALLVSQIPHSLLFDAEEVGYFLRNVVGPIETFNDFQDLPLWRTLTVATTKMFRDTYNRTLIMPMTIWYEPYFDEIMSGLREFEPELFHFCLTARKDTLLERLQNRPHSPEAFAWSCERIDRCVAAFQSPKFAMQIETDEKTPEELVEVILQLMHSGTALS